MSVNFAIRLLIENNDGQSMVISPLALGTSLTSIRYGSQRRTRQELTGIVYPGRSDKEVNDCYGELVHEAQHSDSSIEVKVINKIVLPTENDVNRVWQTKVREKFAAIVENYDFASDEAVVRIVNSTRLEKPDGESLRLLELSDLTRQSRITLVNGASFKGLWAVSYAESRMGMFYGNPSRREPFLKRYCTDSFFYEFNGTVAVALPYKKHDYKLWLVLPPEENTLQEWIHHASETLLPYLMNDAYKERCIVNYPKFRLESNIPAMRNLQHLGLQQMFTERANLGEISDPSTFVTDVIHKAAIEVNEDGVEPFLPYVPKEKREESEDFYQEFQFLQPKDFTANRPFLYMITFKKRILFCGTYY